MAHRHDAVPTLTKLRLPLALTRLGLLAEQVLRCFWPLMSIIMVVLAALMLGLQDHASVELVWGGGIVAVIGALVALLMGARGLHWPTRMDALTRLDASLPGRPIQALIDSQAIGHDDPDSAALWRAHQARMAQRAATARAARPDLRIARRDPFALRYVAMLALAVALLFGSLWRVGSVAEMTPGTAQAAAGPSWEGWIEPPRHTGLPTLYLSDITGAALEAPEGSRVILRFYGEVGALTLAETVSGRIGEVPSASEPSQEFTIARSGELRIDGPGGRTWDVAVIPDAAPRVSVAAPPEAEAAGQMSLPFTAEDDYGIAAGTARISLDLAAVDRRYGLSGEPEPREAIVLPLPMPISGDRAQFTEKLIEDFSQHPWANLPVTFELQVEDDSGQKSDAAPFSATLPGRRFFDPMAAAVIEMRRDLLWSRENAPRIAQVLRAVSYRPDDVFRSETAYLRLRFLLRRLERMDEIGLGDPQVEELAQAMWDLAILLEEGDLGDALERLRRAQERLSEAMKNGASDQEIAELMQELRRATDDYMRQLSRQAQNGENGADQPQQGQNSMQMSQNDLQRMMDRIQELMEQGRMAEAQQALEELQQLMENMRVTQGQGGGQSQGQQSMDDLAETLRNQQGLSDQAFRDLQEQFNPDAQAGENQNNQGRNGGQGRGQSHEGQNPGQQQGQNQGQGQGQNQGQQQGQGQQPGGENGQGGDQAGTLADRQRALRQELNRQQGNLPGAGTPEGDAARDALDRAGRAMDGAEESLRRDDLAEAIDQQSEAMEALREGLRALGEAMAQEQQQGRPGQGQAEGDQRAQNRDPLGRDTGTNGSIGSEENLLQGEDVYRRARELLDEIRRRSGEGERPDVELDYLKRLLERF
ncbi:MAG: TIGR02302 family protein [Pseudooceanicola sp.]|nr:TIGR02302 family protein [Pseudooceanicola sp.]|tara:strand:+ start:189 stop:2813 length:2625 start_codon:yes stop_codon:yes gene_type:complete